MEACEFLVVTKGAHYQPFTLTVQEITLWRKGDVVRKSMSHQAVIASQRFEGSAASESALEQAAKEESG